MPATADWAAIAGNGAGGNTGSIGNTGSLANGRQGGNGAPPGMRLIDMHVMPLPPGTGLPPPGETRFSQNQVVLQFGGGMTPQQIAIIAQRFGLTIVAQQSIGTLGPHGLYLPDQQRSDRGSGDPRDRDRRP